MPMIFECSAASRPTSAGEIYGCEHREVVDESRYLDRLCHGGEVPEEGFFPHLPVERRDEEDAIRPSALGVAASSTASRVPVVPRPTTSGTLPSIITTTASVNRRRSGLVRWENSPVLPSGDADYAGLYVPLDERFIGLQVYLPVLVEGRN